MAEVLTPNAENKLQRGEASVRDRASSLSRSLSFKYYIHDSVQTLRFQLIGDLRAANVLELSGSWETARTTLNLRRLVLDVSQLYSADDEGRAWLLNMHKTGAAFTPANYAESLGSQTATQIQAQAPAVSLSLVGRVMGKICGGER
jgi:hypothetical protein